MMPCLLYGRIVIVVHACCRWKLYREWRCHIGFTSCCSVVTARIHWEERGRTTSRRVWTATYTRWYVVTAASVVACLPVYSTCLMTLLWVSCSCSLCFVLKLWFSGNIEAHYYFSPGRSVKYCDKYVYLSVCLSDCITWKPRGRTSPSFCACCLWLWLVFTRDSIYAIARICHGNSVCLSVCLSVCPSVRHTGGSVKNGWS